MSLNDIINKTIQNNFNIENEDIIENGQINVIKEELENSKSFNQLRSLQILIQKHAGLKELCKYIINNL